VAAVRREPELSTTAKELVKRYWNRTPCGTGDVAELREGDAAFFESLDARRYTLEPFIDQYAGFGRRYGRRVLEIGCGAGGDLLRFARGGAAVTGVDLSHHSAALVRQRFSLAGLDAAVLVADAEQLPFAEGAFDVVYSWGVLHHTPDTARAIAEAHRVLRSGGEAVVMLYHRRSLFALQAWARYALLRGRPWRPVSEVLAAHVESPGTKAYSVAEVRRMFQDAGFEQITVEPVLTPWDARLGRRRFLPPPLRAMIPQRYGWFLVIQARRRQP
jgi:ubiquinone/menaquinone biosynthesis C-methylase UbiE